jgi:hypothetical protein
MSLFLEGRHPERRTSDAGKNAFSHVDSLKE